MPFRSLYWWIGTASCAPCTEAAAWPWMRRRIKLRSTELSPTSSGGRFIRSEPLASAVDAFEPAPGHGIRGHRRPDCGAGGGLGEVHPAIDVPMLVVRRLRRVQGF